MIRTPQVHMSLLHYRVIARGSKRGDERVVLPTSIGYFGATDTMSAGDADDRRSGWPAAHVVAQGVRSERQHERDEATELWPAGDDDRDAHGRPDG